LPVGLFVWTFVADIVYTRSGNPNWFAISYWSSIGGIIAALLAALPGFADYFTMARYSRTAGLATTHMILNLLLVALFTAAMLVMRGIDPTVGEGFRKVLLLHGAGVVALTLSGWLRGEMVFRHRLAVVEPLEPRLAPKPAREELMPQRFGAR